MREKFNSVYLVLFVFLVIFTVSIAGYLFYECRNVNTNTPDSSISDNNLSIMRLAGGGLSPKWNLTFVSQDKSLFYLEFLKYSGVGQLPLDENYSLIYENEYDIYAENDVSLDTSEILFLFRKTEYIVQENRFYMVRSGESFLLNASDYENLREEVNSNGFLDLENKYEAKVLDAGSRFITVWMDGFEKTVRDYGNCAPPQFNQIYNKLKEFVDNRKESQVE